MWQKRWCFLFPQFPKIYFSVQTTDKSVKLLIEHNSWPLSAEHTSQLLIIPQIRAFFFSLRVEQMFTAANSFVLEKWFSIFITYYNEQLFGF